jgi:hypothetical protein
VSSSRASPMGENGALFATPALSVSPSHSEDSIRREVNILDLELYNAAVFELSHTFTDMAEDMRLTLGDSKSLCAQLLDRYLSEMMQCQRQYVLHAHLATAALILYQKDRSRKVLLLRGAYLQSVALELAKPHLKSITEEESVLMMFFASEVAKYGYADAAIQCRSWPDCARDPVSHLLDCMRLVRGTRAVVAPHWARASIKEEHVVSSTLLTGT